MKAAPLLLLLGAAALVVGAAATGGRELQQVTGANCGGVANCNTCSYVRVSGLKTVTLCSKCDAGYTPNVNQTACCEQQTGVARTPPPAAAAHCRCLRAPRPARSLATSP